MRVTRYGYGTIQQQDGTTIHTGVYFLQDDQHRIAVFTGKTAPIAVYADGEVSFTVARKPCACKNDPPKMVLQRLWMDYDRVNA